MTDITISLRRAKSLTKFIEGVSHMLVEKEGQYGSDGGFYDTNYNRIYTHALGEANLKIKQFAKTARQRDLIKAVTWLYLIYEAEEQHGPK